MTELLFLVVVVLIVRVIWLWGTTNIFDSDAKRMRDINREAANRDRDK